MTTISWIFIFLIGLLPPIWTQEIKTSPNESRYTLFIQKTWDNRQVSPSGVTPVSFSPDSVDGQSIIVRFNALSWSKTEENIFSTPSVFGIMFKGERDAILLVEVHRDSDQSVVEVYDGFNTRLPVPKERLTVQLKSNSNTTNWMGNVTIPIQYFPRDTKQIAAYANYSHGSSTKVLSLQHLENTEQETAELPNLLKQMFFQDVPLNKFVPNVDFSRWSDFWQNEIAVTAGGSPALNGTGASKHYANNQATMTNILEQGLVAWILAAAIFCGILHVFVLSI